MSENSIDFCQLIATAKSHLVHHNYPDVMQTCLCGLERLANTIDSAEADRQDTKKLRFKIAIGLLAIQGLVLGKQADDVLLFVEQWFGEVRAWPAEILQICACHYLHLQETGITQDLTEEWLQDKYNQCQCDYEHVVQFYIKNVLVPCNMIKKAQDFLDGCENIPVERMQNLLLCIEKRKNLLTREDQAFNVATASSVSTCHMQKTQSTGSSFSLLLNTVRLCTTTKLVLSSKTMKTTLKTGARLVILVYFLYFIIARTDMPGDIFHRGTGPNILWTAVKRAWISLFAPYHMMAH